MLNVVEVPDPEPGPGELLVRVKAAGINPGEAKIRQGLMDSLFPATFPSGEGSDLAGVIEQVGDGVDAFKLGDEVIGYTDNRASHAELVVVEAENATLKPPEVPWEVAGALLRRRRDRVRGRPRGRPRAWRRGCRLRCRGRSRKPRGAARQARRRDRDRPGERGQPSVAAGPRRDAGDLRRRRRGPNPRGCYGRRRRIHRHAGWWLRRARARARRQARADRHDRRFRRPGEIRRQGRWERGRRQRPDAGDARRADRARRARGADRARRTRSTASGTHTARSSGDTRTARSC